MEELLNAGRNEKSGTRDDSDNPTLRVEFEESLRVLGSLGSECCQTHAAKVRDECGSFANERGFAAFGAVWCRREIGGIGFDHYSFDWD